MSQKISRKCHECGVGRLALVAKAGRTTPYRNIEALPIPADFEIPTCDHCGAEWYGEDIAEALDTVLERQYRLMLRSRIVAAIDVLMKHIASSRLENLLGLSRGYLSRLRNGDKDPSPELFSNLSLLAKNPSERLKELEDLWRAAS